MAVRLVALAAVLAVIALYGVFTARRLDGLHARIDAAAAALDAQLRKRSASVAVLVAELPAALGGGAATAVSGTLAVRGLAHDREVAENLLSRELARLAEEHRQVFLAPSAAAIDVHDDALRASIARRFYNDTVRDALVIRDRRTVRWLRLAGHAPHPAYFEMDDEELPTPANSVVKRHKVEV
ncbi:MAG TPA: NUDIX hydrolase [Mycobacteriales bacterium]|nr:NUDIX hydrolase [Mycobacteriales bacterium]HWA66007.1 NUDIX hydrolase [Mycobacteriales bacterium]